MPITIGSNISSLKARRQLDQTSHALSKTFERLSSGQRINSASDDAAGLAISESLRSDKKVFTQGIRNLNDGTSVLNIADGALEQLSNIVVRIRELTEQSANGTFSNTQRKSIDVEAQALTKEYARITQSTKFNGRNLFDANFQDLRVQAGYGVQGGIASGLGGALGTGSLAAGTSYVTISGFNSALQLGDVNRDGILDLVTAGQGGSDAVFGIQLGNGDGSFAAVLSYNVVLSAFAKAVDLADINGDGILDVITAGGTNVNVGFATVSLGNGNGTFRTATSFASESVKSNAVKLNDLNGDGFLDLITAGGSASDGYATIQLGNGSGSFGSATSYATESRESQGVQVADLNSDGILDLITAGYTDAGDGYATIRFGSGNGSFGAATSYTTESAKSYALQLADLNGDGSLDLVTAGSTDAGDGFATVRLGNVSGSFGAATSFSTEDNASFALKLADLNGDGFLDLVTAGLSDTPDGFATVRLGNGSGTFEAATSYATESRQSNGLQLGDLNGDGVLDMLTNGITDGFASTGTVSLARTVNGVSPLLQFSLLTQADALQAMAPLDRKLAQIANQRGTIGAFQSRIASAVNTIGATVENYAAAESRIRDTDIASESANLTRLGILQNAASAILAQANQAPALALQLLK